MTSTDVLARGSYKELKQLILEQGLLNKQTVYYTYKIISLLGMLVASMVILALVPNPWLQMLNAVFFAFLTVQTGLIMHDADHTQIFKSLWMNRLCGLIAANLVTGISSGRWNLQHNRHHGSPNHTGLDPDVNIPYIAFSEDQALGKRGIARFICKNQALLWFPLISLYAFRMRILYLSTLLNNLRGHAGEYSIEHPLGEAVLAVASNVLYFGIVFFFLDVWHGALFVVVHHALTGIYMASVFATNHKGMPLINKHFDFLQMQVITARNVKSNRLTHLFMGGLDYQIEHHLFPTMPRCNLKKARDIVKPYCEKHGIDYYETGFLRSYIEILQNFYQVSSVLRRPVKT